MELILAYLMVGVLAGTLAGMLGVGGGLLVVPALVAIFHYQGFTQGPLMQMAVGTSLVTIVFTSLSSIRAHHLREAVRWDILKNILPGTVSGALLGAFVADAVDSATLQRIFAAFILFVSAQMLFQLRLEPSRNLPARFGLWGAGGVIGCLSSMAGVGGGTMTVPFLVYCSVPIRQAVGTSAACGLPIAVMGALAFILMGWNEPDRLPWSTGYLYWPAAIVIVMASILFAPLGAYLSHKLDARYLKMIFAVFLAMVGVRLFL